jgi:hypothetical protein
MLTPNTRALNKRFVATPAARVVVDFHAELTRVFHRELTRVNLWFAVHAEVKFLPFSLRLFGIHPAKAAI